MTQSRPSYTYNPDVPVRRWHQKWINPLISLQNAPPTSHGTPAPTKEEGEVGHAGFKVYTWIPLDEDEDVTDEKLAEEVDWWNLPGAPVRPEVREAMRMQSAEPEVTIVEDKSEDVMQVDAPTTKDVNGTGGGEEETNVAGTEEVAPPVVSPVVSAKAVSPASAPVPAEVVDTEMTDVLSPVHLAAVPGSSPSSLHASPPPITTTFKSPSPLPIPATQPLETAQSPSKSSVPPPVAEPTTMEDIFPPPSKPSPPSDPLAQAKEVAAGLAIETPLEHAEHARDAGALSGVGGGIAGEGMVGAGTEDLRDEEEEERRAEVGDGEQRTEVEKILEETKKDLDTEIVKDSVDQ